MLSSVLRDRFGLKARKDWWPFYGDDTSHFLFFRYCIWRHSARRCLAWWKWPSPVGSPRPFCFHHLDMILQFGVCIQSFGFGYPTGDWENRRRWRPKYQRCALKRRESGVGDLWIIKRRRNAVYEYLSTTGWLCTKLSKFHVKATYKSRSSTWIP